MRYDTGYESSNVEDRRGSGGGGGLPIGKLGIGGTLIVGVLSLIFGRNLFTSSPSGRSTRGPDPADEEARHFVAFVLDDAQSVWKDVLPSQAHARYRDAKLVLFDDPIETACGDAESAIGPFYCPGDEKVYIDLGFYAELRDRLGAPGQFAQAYVIAHELGHHVQNLLGTEKRMRGLQRGKSTTEKNELSVRLELQADCYAGIWARSTQDRSLLERGDVESAMGAAAAVGDDRLQKAARGTVNPEKFTHGSSASRVRWFNAGFDSGQLDACDTFAPNARL
ncbi:MAG: neutral zinc metallopeptidase [Polyangiaceae bacterium]